ncbi:adhesion G-protein coupled receptor G6 [Osmerus eperlanus]|uniref:adhesion G-protein coupled receptor G6 n=1 Tax=Osmerus eperlanus TaxID=29151 RepID=UPI002E0F6590
MALINLMVWLVVLPWITSAFADPCNVDGCSNVFIVDDEYSGLILNHTSDQNCSAPSRKEVRSQKKCKLLRDTCLISFNRENVSSECRENNFWMQTRKMSTLLYMSKQRVSDNMVLCVITGNNCSATPSSTLHLTESGNCSVTCVRPKEKCKIKKFDEVQCKDIQDGENFIINMTQSQVNCYNCYNATKEPKQKISSPSLTNTDEDHIDPVKASQAMKKMSSLVSEMNETSAFVSMGEVKGILVKQEDPVYIEPFSFGYTNSTINIVQDLVKLDGFSRSVTISKEAFQKVYNSTNGTSFAGVFWFPNFAKDLKNSTVLNNEVVAIEMGAFITNLTEKISLSYRNINKEGASASCQSWGGEGSQPNWTTDGCLTIEQGQNITCECTHLTFFAVLMSPPNITISDEDLSYLTYITSAGCGLSLFFQSVALFIHFLIRKNKASDATRILIQLFIAMFLLNFTFLTNAHIANLRNTVGCQLMATIMHFSMLSTFTWFGVMALHLCLQMYMAKSIIISHYILKVYIVGWVLPCVVVAVLFSLGKYGEQVIHTSGGKDVMMCWIGDPNVHYIVNIGYYAVVFVFTFITFIIVLRWMVYLKSTETDTDWLGLSAQKMVAIFGLSCLLGITWSFAFFASGPLRVPSYYIFSILNSFQGFFLFLYYYKTSRVIGATVEDSSGSGKSSFSTINMNFKPHINPYANQKQH